MSSQVEGNIFDKTKFNQQLEVPYISVKNELIGKIHPKVKPFLLKKVKLNPLQDGNEDDGIKDILFEPTLFKSKENELRKEFNSLGLELDFKFKKVNLTYENYTIEDALKQLVPQSPETSELNVLSSWSTIGHIVQVNLREHLHPYKLIIGQVLLDKLQPQIKMIVNKTSAIDNEFRNFEMEILAKVPGEVSTVVQVSSLGCKFKFDFAKVYWNPRLSTEHERIIKTLRPGMDNLYDVFAGVGPFSVPAAKRKCKVLANDLNPHSYEALCENSKMNKVTNYISCYNLDGREFIKNIVSADLVKEWKALQSGDECKVKQFHITMNLPALAIEFLNSFGSWMDHHQEEIEKLTDFALPMIHCYCFVKRKNDSEAEKEIIERAETAIGCKINKIEKIYHVRNVAPFKEMYRLVFELPRHLVVKKSDQEQVTKKLKVSND